MTKYFVMLAVLVLLCGLPAVSNAGFTADNARSLVYDSDQNLTWLMDASQLGASDYNGAWSIISNLNATNYLGYNDWSLPYTYDMYAPQGYYNGGQLADLYYDQGISPTSSSPFTNLVAGYYWYGDPEFWGDPGTIDPYDNAWAFNFSTGFHC